MARRFSRSLHDLSTRIQIALVACCLCTAGCSPLQSPALRLGSSIWPGDELFYLARDQHFWREDQIHLIEYTSTAELSRAFRNGTLDGGLCTLDEALLLVQERQDIHILLVTDVSNGADVILAKPNFRDLKDLRGRRIGVESTGVGAYVLSRALELADLTVHDVEIVPLEFSEEQDALEKGSVDAVVTYEPVRTKLKNAGARQLFDSTAISGEILDVLVVRTSYLTASPDNARLLVEAFFRAQRYARENPGGFVKGAAVREKVTPQEFRESMTLLRVPDAKQGPAMFAGAPSPLQKQAQSLAEVMIQKRLLLGPVDVASMFDQRPLHSDAP